MRFSLPALLLLASCSHLQRHPATPYTYANTQDARVDRAHYEAFGQHFAISTQGNFTTAAAREVLDAGGNLIDAAIAASFVISVERPHSTGLGGGGFMVFHIAKENKTYAVDFRERAPARATEKMFLNAKGEVIPNLSLDGPLAVGVPGLVVGLYEIHARYGSKPWSELLQPAIRLAEQGFRIYPALAAALDDRRHAIARFASSRAIFFGPNGLPLKTGDLLVQRDLASTLRAIARDGKTALYSPKTPLGRQVIAGLHQAKVLVNAQDLATYRVRWLEPLRGTYLGRYTIESMPPPSSGGTHVLEILHTLENAHLHQIGFQQVKSLHLEASAMQLAFADRAKYLGDPDAETKVPTRGLTSHAYGRRQLERIDPKQATPSDQLGPGNPWPYESDHTTHLSFMDEAGNAIATTQTINGPMGSALVLPGTGIVLNNEMDDFSAKPGALNYFGAVGSRANRIRPGKTPLSSMSPTLVFENGKPVLSVGAPGGTRIITCVAQTILRTYEYRIPLYDAIAAVRIHHQWQPDRIVIDQPGLPEAEMQGLQKMGHHLSVEAPGCIALAVERDADGKLHAVADPREEGSASAY